MAANPQGRDIVAPFLRTCDGCSSSRPVQGVPDALRHRWETPNNNTKHTQHVHIALMQRTCVRMLSRFPVISMETRRRRPNWHQFGCDGIHEEALWSGGQKTAIDLHLPGTTAAARVCRYTGLHPPPPQLPAGTKKLQIRFYNGTVRLCRLSARRSGSCLFQAPPVMERPYLGDSA